MIFRIYKFAKNCFRFGKESRHSEGGFDNRRTEEQEEMDQLKISYDNERNKFQLSPEHDLDLLKQAIYDKSPRDHPSAYSPLHPCLHDTVCPHNTLRMNQSEVVLQHGAQDKCPEGHATMKTIGIHATLPGGVKDPAYKDSLQSHVPTCALRCLPETSLVTLPPKSGAHFLRKDSSTPNTPSLYDQPRACLHTRDRGNQRNPRDIYQPKRLKAFTGINNSF